MFPCSGSFFSRKMSKYSITHTIIVCVRCCLNPSSAAVWSVLLVLHSSVISGFLCPMACFLNQWCYSLFRLAELNPSVSDTKPLLSAATAALIVTFSDRPPPRAVLPPPPPRPPLPPRAPPRPRPGRPRSPKLISSWDVMSLAGLRKWWSLDSSGLA